MAIWTLCHPFKTISKNSNESVPTGCCKVQFPSHEVYFPERKGQESVPQLCGTVVHSNDLTTCPSRVQAPQWTMSPYVGLTLHKASNKAKMALFLKIKCNFDI